MKEGQPIPITTHPQYRSFHGNGYEHPNGGERFTHPPEEHGRVPFAFDLQREYDLIQRYGERYRPFWKDQVRYFLTETYAKVPKTEYTHDIQRDANGNVELLFGPMKQRALKSYREPLHDTSLPLWYRKRAMGDVRWVQNIQEKLSHAKEGDMFIDISPTEFGVNVEERKKWGFGWHSFVRVHQIVRDEQGNEKLVSRPLRNYLDLPEQQHLFETVTGKSISREFILGEVEQLKKGIELGHIDGMVQKLYDETPEERKIILPGDQLFKSDQEMKDALANMQQWIDRVFTLMRKRRGKSQIQTEFRGIEMAMKAFVNGEDIDLSQFSKTNPQGLRQIEEDQISEAMYQYMSRQYTAGMNGCGNGSGFGETITPWGTVSSVKKVSGLMNYQGITKKERDYSFDQPGPCRLCYRDVQCGPCKVCEQCNNRIDTGELVVQAA